MTAPPLPIGQAITTNQASVTVEATRPKMSLAEAVKQALPPERRAILHASLARKGLLSSTASAHVVPSQPLGSPSELSAPAAASVDSETNVSHDAGGGQKRHLSSSALQPPWSDGVQCSRAELTPGLDPANQAPLIPSQLAPRVNISMNASDAVNFGGLADWSQPDPCWLGSVPQQESSSGTFAPPTAAHDTYQHTTAREEVYNAPAIYGDALSQLPPDGSFSSVEIGEYGETESHPASRAYSINTNNSAVIALSDLSSAGQMQGHLYSLNGELIGQGLVDQTGPGRRAGTSMTQEDMGQYDAIEQLLSQIIATGSQPSTSTHLDGDTLGMPSYQHQEYHAEEWPAGFPSFSQPHPNFPDNSCQRACYDGSQESSAMYKHTYDAMQAHSLLHRGEDPYRSSYTNSQRRVASPVRHAADTNFSRPMVQEDPTRTQTIDPSQTYLRTQTLAESSTLEAAGVVIKKDPSDRVQEENSQAAIHRGLRNWKANQLNAVREKLARIKHRASPTSAHTPLPATES